MLDNIQNNKVWGDLLALACALVCTNIFLGCVMNFNCCHGRSDSRAQVVVFSKSYCPYCAKAKQALSGVLPQDKFKVLEVRHSG